MRIDNKSFIDIESCEEIFSLESNEATVTKISLDIEKIPGCRYTIEGGQIRWCTVIKNNSEIDLEDLTFRDVLASGTSYVTGSFTVNGTAATPIYDHATRVLTYHIEKIEEDEEITICFKVNVS